MFEVDTYHIIHVKDDRFIGHGLNLSWKGKTSPPSRLHGCQDLHTPLKSQGHTADSSTRGGGLEAAHSPAGRGRCMRSAGGAGAVRKNQEEEKRCEMSD